MNYFWIDRQWSRKYGLIATAINPYTAAERRQELVRIHGKGAPYVVDYGTYNPIDRQYEISIVENLRVKTQSIRDWLASAPFNRKANGYTRFVETYNPEHYLRIYGVSGFPDFVQSFNLYGSGTLTFTCDPYRYTRIGETPQVYPGGVLSMHNPTKYSSRPIIKVFSDASSGGGTLRINGIQITVGVQYRNFIINTEELTITDEAGVNLRSKSTITGGRFEDVGFLPGENSVYSSHTCDITANWREI